MPESRRSMLFATEPVYKNISISILERIGRLLLQPGSEREIAQRHVDSLKIRPLSVEHAAAAAVGRQPAEGGAGASG